MPNLAIVGYGKMGLLIDQLAPEYGFNVTARLDVGRDESRAPMCTNPRGPKGPKSALTFSVHASAKRPRLVS